MRNSNTLDFHSTLKALFFTIATSINPELTDRARQLPFERGLLSECSRLQRCIAAREGNRFILAIYKFNRDYKLFVISLTFIGLQHLEFSGILILSMSNETRLILKVNIAIRI